MSQAIIDALIDSGEATLVDGTSIEPYLDAAPATATALFFTGDPAKKLETADLAVILREISRTREGAVRLAVVDRKDERALMGEYDVRTLPSAVFVAGRRRLETIPKVKDWAVYEVKDWAVYEQKVDRILARAAEGVDSAGADVENREAANG